MNDVLGYITCESGGRASVHQAKRGNGLFLYTRCDCCGCDQRTGAAVQTRLFNGTTWRGDTPKAPPNLITAVAPVKTTEKQPEATEVQPEWEPEKVDSTKVEAANSEPIGSFGGVLAGVGFVCGVVLLSMAGVKR